MQPDMNFAPQPRNQFVSDQSAADLSAVMGHVSSSGQLSIEFFYRQVRIEDPTNPADHGQYRAVLCVRRRPHGDMLTESTRMITERMAQQLYPREFAFFKQNQDVPTNGTPLSELPGISQSQISILVIFNIRCVEDLVALQPEQITPMGMDARQAYGIAKKWMEARQANGELIRDAAREAQLTAELESLRASKASQDTALAEMRAKLDLMMQMQGKAPVQELAPDGSVKPVLVDADDLPDAPESELFTGAQMVTGNDDLDDGPNPPPSLPGLDRKKR
jgi:hypothetical protein